MKDCMKMEQEFANLNPLKQMKNKDPSEKQSMSNHHTFGLSTEQLAVVKNGGRASGSILEMNVPEKIQKLEMSESELKNPRFQEEVGLKD